MRVAVLLALCCIAAVVVANQEESSVSGTVTVVAAYCGAKSGSTGFLLMGAVVNVTIADNATSVVGDPFVINDCTVDNHCNCLYPTVNVYAWVDSANNNIYIGFDSNVTAVSLATGSILEVTTIDDPVFQGFENFQPIGSSYVGIVSVSPYGSCYEGCTQWGSVNMANGYFTTVKDFGFDVEYYPGTHLYNAATNTYYVQGTSNYDVQLFAINAGTGKVTSTVQGMNFEILGFAQTKSIGSTVLIWFVYLTESGQNTVHFGSLNLASGTVKVLGTLPRSAVLQTSSFSYDASLFVAVAPAGDRPGDYPGFVAVSTSGSFPSVSADIDLQSILGINRQPPIIGIAISH